MGRRSLAACQAGWTGRRSILCHTAADLAHRRRQRRQAKRGKTTARRPTADSRCHCTALHCPSCRMPTTSAAHRMDGRIRWRDEGIRGAWPPRRASRWRRDGRSGRRAVETDDGRVAVAVGGAAATRNATIASHAVLSRSALFAASSLCSPPPSSPASSSSSLVAPAILLLRQDFTHSHTSDMTRQCTHVHDSDRGRGGWW